jgi:hypothetical protein
MGTVEISKDKIRTRPKLVRKLRLVMFLGLIGGPIVFGIGYYQYLEVAKLREEGKTTEGTVVDSSTLATGKGRTSCRLVVDYKPEGFPIHRKEFLGVLPQVFEQATATRKIPVRYLASKPAVSAIGEQIRADTEPMAIGVGVFVVSFLIWLYFRKKAKGSRLEGVLPKSMFL